jgi:superfamily I DNA/RNA helicase
MLSQNGDQLERSGDFEAVRKRITTGLSGLSDSSVSENQLDCILLDEAQDYTVEEIRMLKRLCKQIFAVGDDRQRIYRAEGALAALEQICGIPKILRFNYRNGLKICRLADSIRNELDSDDGLESSSNYDERKFPSSVSSFKDLSLEEQVLGVCSNVETQLRAYQEGMIGVLAPKRATVSSMADLFRESNVAEHVQVQQFESGYASIDPKRRVLVTTIHGAKGLEFRALHLLAMDTLKKFPLQKKLAYTAVTRAKTSLSIYSDAALPGYLEQAVASVDPGPVKTPDLGDLFSR